LIGIEWIDVGSIGHRIGDFPIDRIGLLREYCLAGNDEKYDSHNEASHKGAWMLA
jgi:hypothetical protein